MHISSHRTAEAEQCYILVAVETRRKTPLFIITGAHILEMRITDVVSGIMDVPRVQLRYSCNGGEIVEVSNLPTFISRLPH